MGAGSSAIASRRLHSSKRSVRSWSSRSCGSEKSERSDAVSAREEIGTSDDDSDDELSEVGMANPTTKDKSRTLSLDEAVPLETLAHGASGEARMIADYKGMHVYMKTFAPAEASVDSSDLCHPNIVRVLGRRFVDGQTTEMRELCEGGELFDVIVESGGLRDNQSLVVRWIKEICSALAYCHEQGAVNGQLRPEQVLLDSHNSVKLLGFLSFRSEAIHLSRPASVLDAPELHGRELFSVQELKFADMWAVGVLLTAMLTGLPFGETDSMRWKAIESVTKHGLKKGLPDLVALVPPLLLPALEATLHHEPAMRPSAKDLLELAEWLHDAAPVSPVGSS